MIRQLLLLLSLLAILPLTACTEDAPVMMIKGRTNFKVYTGQMIAHRGGVEGTPYRENSLEAIYECGRIGMRQVEIDIRTTSDDVLILAHDDSIRKKAVSEHSYEQLSVAMGFPLPTLEEVTDIMHIYPEMIIFLDIKDANIGHVDNVIREAGLLSRTVVITGDDIEATGYFSLGYKVLKLLYNPVSQSMLRAYSEGYYGINISMESLKANLQIIEDAHEAGLMVGVWTVNDAGQCLNMLSKGVDFITTDMAQKFVKKEK